jgi:SAM-dependent methyltransferase
MHPQAMQWVADHATTETVDVLDIGGRDVGGEWGGSPRHLFPNATTYTVLDCVPGPDVDIVADAADFVPIFHAYDVVVCCETFEHTDRWPGICKAAYEALRPGGRLILTMAGPGRPPHGAWGAPDLGVDEHYANVRPERLQHVLAQRGFADVVIDRQANPADLRAVATKP